MKKIIISLMLILLIPLNVCALSDSYNNVASKIIGEKPTENKIDIYLFHGAECPHCKEEKQWLKIINNKYKEFIKIHYYEVWHNKNNAKLMEEVKKKYKIKQAGVPLTIIGEDYYIGYSKAIGSNIENKITKYIKNNNTNKINIPIIGKKNIKEISIPLVAVILGFIDGFNPCAMWILLFLINMLFGMKNKKRSWILGLTFLIVSGIVYFLSMLGIDFVVEVATINWMKTTIAIFILTTGVLNLNKYITIRKESVGCTVVDDKKRKKLISKIRKIINNNSFILSLIGIITLAVSVNIIELACSLGFPVVFTEILTVNKIKGIMKILYLIIYIFFYMIDDIVVFSISMITLEATGITNKYNKLCTLISAIIMIITGILLIFKSEWLMLNF